uniref:Peptidase A1 domain-containing protein n=1 Tax=Ananas comosus var. bracteatus TaxID=296719 RepID=A0A6V7QHN5_ANACO|nr:unnamed protein product [Ananas comosus var. bracteatus]
MAKSFQLYLLLILSIHFGPSSASLSSANFSASRNPLLRGIELPSFNAVASDSGCSHHRHRHRRTSSPVDESEAEKPAPPPPLKLQLRQQAPRNPNVRETAQKDVLRIQTLFRRIADRKNQNSTSRLARTLAEKEKEEEKKTDDCGGAAKSGGGGGRGEPAVGPELAGRLVATLESGVTLGAPPASPASTSTAPSSTPPPPPPSAPSPAPTPAAPSSPPPTPRPPALPLPLPLPLPLLLLVRRLLEHHRRPRARDVHREPHLPDDGSSAFRRVDNVIFGCGHWNRGLFHGAAGLLGLGRGPLSFASQLRGLYGHAFSYCLVDRDSDMSVSSKLIFGEDRRLLAHPDLNYTAFVAGKDNPADTFYYVQIKGILVGGHMLQIPPETWELSGDGRGGTIVDSGTTLSYFADPAYRVIREAFVERVKKYPMVDDFPVLNPCYNVSGVEEVELPEFAIVFADGAVWNFPVENYFIRLEPEEMVCLAILGTPRSALSIIGNYQQQNFHILYDLDKSRLGFAPMRCAEV